MSDPADFQEAQIKKALKAAKSAGSNARTFTQEELDVFAFKLVAAEARVKELEDFIRKHLPEKIDAALASGEGKQFAENAKCGAPEKTDEPVSERAILDPRKQALAECKARAMEIASHYDLGTDGRNTFLLFADWIDARIEACPVTDENILAPSTSKQSLPVGPRDPVGNPDLPSADDLFDLIAAWRDKHATQSSDWQRALERAGEDRAEVSHCSGMIERNNFAAQSIAQLLRRLEKSDLASEISVPGAHP